MWPHNTLHQVLQQQPSLKQKFHLTTTYMLFKTLISFKVSLVESMCCSVINHCSRSHVVGFCFCLEFIRGQNWTGHISPIDQAALHNVPAKQRGWC